MRTFLRTPLIGKVAGANAVILVTAITVSFAIHGFSGSGGVVLRLMTVALAASLVVNLVLVYIALRPLQALEDTATRVWRGGLDARVPPSPLADRNVARVGHTLNLLLDALMSERTRMRALATQIITAQDEERARIARELHDSTAQSLAALNLQLAAAVRQVESPPLLERLEMVRQMAGDVLEEVRTLSHTVHPRVLDDLGLPAALEWLVRRTREDGSVELDVATAGVESEIPHTVGSTLYRVAQEALRNAVRHAGASAIHVALWTDGQDAMLRIEDDGCGFDVAEAESRRPGMGLFSMRERIALVDGTFSLTSAPGTGTVVEASVPLLQTGAYHG